MDLTPFALTVPLIFAVAYTGYHYYSREHESVKALRRELVKNSNNGIILQSLLIELNSSWAKLDEASPQLKNHVQLAELVAYSQAALMTGSSATQSPHLQRHKFTGEDFESAGISDYPGRISTLIEDIGDPELSDHWRARKAENLAAMLRLLHRQIFGRLIRQDRKEEPVELANPVLSMIRNEADSAVICASINQQSRAYIKDLRPDESQIEKGEIALDAIVRACSYLRDEHGKPFTLGSLVVTLLPHGLEELYRECRTLADKGNGWPAQCKPLRSYVETLPGWDGRMPMADMTLASHTQLVGAISRFLVTVK